MKRVRAWMRRIWAMFQRERDERELAAEMESHVEMHMEDNLRAGMTSAEARREALMKLGGVEQTKEIYRERRGLPWLETLWKDLRFGARMLRKSPGFTIVAIFTFALGIGMSTAIFSVVDGVLLKALPYPEADRLCMIWQRIHLPFYQSDRNEASSGDFWDWRSRNSVFEDMGAVRYRSYNVSDAGEPVHVEGEAVSASFFSVLRTGAALGRVFTPEEDRPGGPQVVVLGYGLWASRFGASSGAVGKSIRFDGVSYTVIGVMPRWFRFPDPDDQFWVPLAMTPADVARRGRGALRIIARLKKGVTLTQARAEMAAIAEHLAEEYPRTNLGESVNVVSLREQTTGDVRPALLVLMVAAGFIVLIVCANIANLLLARGASRRREMAIRSALGASESRILRQLLSESLLLSSLGSALALLLASWGVHALKILSPADMPRVGEIAVNGSVLAFSLAVSVVSAVLFGLAPALHAARWNAHSALSATMRQTASDGRVRVRKLLVVCETVLGVVVIIGAGLLLRSFQQLGNVALGFQSDGVLTFRVIPRGENYSQGEVRAAFYQQALERIQALPGVKSAAAVSFVPLTFIRRSGGFSIEGRVAPSLGQTPVALSDVVTPGYFQTMEIPLRSGRDFSWNDTPRSPGVVLVNETGARTYWPNENPVGKRIKQGNPDASTPWLTVVGVVGDVRQFDIAMPSSPAIYFPAAQLDEWTALRDWVVRAAGDPRALAPAIRSVLRDIDKDLPVSRVQTMEQVRWRAVAPQRFNALLLGLFACLALVLATVALYGVLSYEVGRRTREIGIRMALGAQPRDVLRMVIGEGTALTFSGVAIGMAAALALTRLMSRLLYGVSPTDLPTFVGVAALLSSVALVACYLPARRAMRVDPMTALRHE